MGLTQKQLALRKTGITATDVRAIVGIDPYGMSPHDIFASKVLDVEPRKSSELFELSHAIEPIIVKQLAKVRGIKVMRVAPSEMTRAHPTARHHLATPDALFCGETAFHIDSLGEVKVVSPFQAEGWGKPETEIPDWCVVQCAWQMHVCDVPLVHVGALIWPSIRTYTVRRDLELEATLVEEVDRFWVDHVLAKRPPTVDGSAGAERMMKRLHPNATGPRFRASPEVEAIARRYFEGKRGVVDAEKFLALQEQLLQLACGEADGIDGDGWRLHYRNREGYRVEPDPYEVKPRRHFDMRATAKASRR